MARQTDVLLLVNAMMGQFISGVATRIFILMAVALSASLLRGGRRIEAAALD